MRRVVFLLISLSVSQTSGEVRNTTGCGAGGAKLVKIQGGSPVGPWPWLCGLEVDRRLRCGATIIQTSPHLTILLTAAHCFHDIGDGDHLQVVCGNPHLQNSSLVNGVTLTVRGDLIQLLVN